MLRWNSERCTVESAELPPWWINNSGKECAQNLLNSSKSFIELQGSSAGQNAIELIDPQLRDDIFKLKCDIFNAEGDEQQLGGGRGPIPLAERERIRRARAVANPFEQIGRSVFINRAAVKLASIDAALGFALTENNPQRRDGNLYFADLCGGPGGFSEYIIWRLEESLNEESPSPFEIVRGFGLTLKGRHDDFQQSHWWSLQKLRIELPFKAVYGPTDDSDGDITKLQNRQAFIETVRAAAPNGCGLVLGDGGFDMSGKEEKQELLISKLLAFQYACALPLLAPGGSFLCKLFDVATPITASLLYILSAFFEKMTIIKPVTSRPANGERYVVCLNFLPPDNASIVDGVVSLLTRAGNAIDPDSEDGDNCVADILPIESIPRDFLVFLRNLNNKIAVRQKVALVELLAETRDPTGVIGWNNSSAIVASSAIKLANECSKLWHLPPVGQQQPVGSARSLPITNNGASSYRPPGSGLTNGGSVPRNNGFTRPESASSVLDWRAQKKQTPPIPQQHSFGSGANTTPFYNNNNNASNGKGFFGKNTPINGGQWKPSGGLADSVANWRRQSPAQ